MIAVETDLVWTRHLVKARIAEAARNLQRMPGLTDRDRPARLRTTSLERNYRPAFDDAFAAAVDEVTEKGRQSAPKVRLGPPDPLAIDRMYETIDWLMWLNTRQRRICMGKALRKSGVLWRQFGVHRTTINTWHNQAINHLVRELNTRGIRVREAEE